MPQQPSVPPATVQRLPLYLRCLVQLQSQRLYIANSVKIAELAGTNAAQVRKDLSYLGEFGIRGLGYEVNGLIAHLTRWLGLQATRNVVILGHGRLGAALQGYGGLQDRGFLVRAILDVDPEKIGIPLPGGLQVEPLDKLTDIAREREIEIAILTVPVNQAERVARDVVDAGIKAILNFAPVRLDLPEGVCVRQADVAAELQILSYHLREESL